MAGVPDFNCHKCGATQSVWILPTSGGRGTGESTSYGGYCNACKSMLLDDLPSNCDGKKATAIREFKRFQKGLMSATEPAAKGGEREVSLTGLHQGDAATCTIVDELVAPAAVAADEIDPEAADTGLNGLEGNLSAAADADPHCGLPTVGVDLHDSQSAAGVQGEGKREAKPVARDMKEGRWCPDECPITGLPFFMWLDHPERGYVPTYGGPFDSYTLARVDEDGDLRSERYDHDEGAWVDGGESMTACQELADAIDNRTPSASPAAPEGYALVPLRMNREMERIAHEGDWQWEDMLAAAGAITPEQYDEIGASPAALADDDIVILQRVEQALSWIAAGHTPDRNHDLDGAMRKATIRDAMGHASRVLSDFRKTYVRLIDA